MALGVYPLGEQAPEAGLAVWEEDTGLGDQAQDWGGLGFLAHGLFFPQGTVQPEGTRGGSASTGRRAGAP